MTRDDLIAFEDEMAALFEAGKIKAPLHLAGGNELQLIEIFKNIRHDDWVLGSWRSHYHCLLKGVPAELVRRSILDGRSIALCFPAYRVLCSAIVGGIAPIAVGIAEAIKRSRRDEKVWCFVGDMTAETGIFNEAFRYARGHDLPVRFIIENNGLSVCTDTLETWGDQMNGCWPSSEYRYTLTKPHVGTGTWVAF